MKWCKNVLSPLYTIPIASCLRRGASCLDAAGAATLAPEPPPAPPPQPLHRPQALWVRAHRPGPHPVYSPAPRKARAAPGCRAGTPDSPGQLQRPSKGLRRCPRPRPARDAHCPVAGYRRVLSREPPPGWSPRPRLRRSTGRIRSKWRWNLQTPGTTGATEGAPEVRDRRLGLAGASGGTARSLH